MVEVLQSAALLAVPLLLVGGLLWLLIYSAVRLALRHEVTRLENRRARRVRARPRAEGPHPSGARTRPSLVEDRSSGARAS